MDLLWPYDNLDNTYRFICLAGGHLPDNYHFYPIINKRAMMAL